MGYTKLFDRLVRSSVWDLPDKVRIVWITMLALADREGVVISTEKSLSLLSRVDMDSTRVALDSFLRPDPETLTSAHEGRRIEVVESGWKILNYGKYREMLRSESRREYQREWQRKKRAKRSGNVAIGTTLTERIILKAEKEGDHETARRMAEIEEKRRELDEQSNDEPALD